MIRLLIVGAAINQVQSSSDPIDFHWQSGYRCSHGTLEQAFHGATYEIQSNAFHACADACDARSDCTNADLYYRSADGLSTCTLYNSLCGGDQQVASYHLYTKPEVQIGVPVTAAPVELVVNVDCAQTHLDVTCPYDSVGSGFHGEEYNQNEVQAAADRCVEACVNSPECKFAGLHFYFADPLTMPHVTTTHCASCYLYGSHCGDWNSNSETDFIFFEGFDTECPQVDPCVQNGERALYEQCGGAGYEGCHVCQAGLSCQAQQCQPVPVAGSDLCQHDDLDCPQHAVGTGFHGKGFNSEDENLAVDECWHACSEHPDCHYAGLYFYTADPEAMPHVTTTHCAACYLYGESCGTPVSRPDFTLLQHCEPEPTEPEPTEPIDPCDNGLVQLNEQCGG